MLEVNRKLRYISSYCFIPTFKVLDIHTGGIKNCFVFFAIDSVTGRILHYTFGCSAAATVATETIDTINFVNYGIWCVPDKRPPPLGIVKFLRTDNPKASEIFLSELNEYINIKNAIETILPSYKSIMRSKVPRLSLLDFKMFESFVIHCIYDWPQNVLCRICKPNEIASDVVNNIVELAVQRVNALLERKPAIFCTRAPKS
ncbi:hypothetical protein D3C84_834120 [compost metagenome]